MAPGLFQLMRKNWKRSAFYLTTANTALWFTYDYTVTNDLMKTCSRRATKYGDTKLKNFNSQPRHITVILNPVANKRKSKKLYNKWVEPLLHLAGIKISLIETESQNQAHDLMKIMSNCDGVAIVGGDGTVHEALNGLLTRPDCTKAIKEFPIAIIPTGQFNSIARYIHRGLHYRNQKEFLIQSTMSLLDSQTERHDVIKISPLSKLPDDSVENSNPIYALRDVRYGKYQDNFYKVSGYKLYQSYIKPYWLRLKRMFGSRNLLPQIESISYTEPCEGCSRCYERHRLKDIQVMAVNEDQNINRSWWSRLTPLNKTSPPGPTAEELKERELAKRDNPNCDRWKSVTSISDITDFRACMMGEKKIRLSLGVNGEYEPSEVIETQDVKLKVASHLDEEKNSSTQIKSNEAADNKAEEAEESKKTEFLIDGQPVQAHSIEVSAINKAVTIFTGCIFTGLNSET